MAGGRAGARGEDLRGGEARRSRARVDCNCWGSPAPATLLSATAAAPQLRPRRHTRGRVRRQARLRARQLQEVSPGAPRGGAARAGAGACAARGAPHRAPRRGGGRLDSAPEGTLHGRGARAARHALHRQLRAGGARVACVGGGAAARRDRCWRFPRQPACAPSSRTNRRAAAAQGTRAQAHKRTGRLKSSICNQVYAWARMGRGRGGQSMNMRHARARTRPHQRGAAARHVVAVQLPSWSRQPVESHHLRA